MYPGIKCRFALAMVFLKDVLFALEKLNIGLFQGVELAITTSITGTSLGPTPITSITHSDIN